MSITRREVLRLLAASPLAIAGGSCATQTYPRAIATVAGMSTFRPILEPKPRAVRVDSTIGRVVDVHAHFFNASDVPVRGFIAECLAHSASPVARRLLTAMAPLADRMSRRAPTAADEIDRLRTLHTTTAAASLEDAQAAAQVAVQLERQNAAERVAEVIRGSEFERVYRELKSGTAVPVAQGGTSADAILSTVSESETPSADAVAAAAQTEDAAAKTADGMMGFLYYMLSYRSNNVDAYIAAFRRHDRSFGVDMVLGSLVDFDRWLERPPRSAHDDQVELHALLAQLHGGFLRPVVAYNPWSDLEQDRVGLARVERAFQQKGFVAVKIYPPTGFMPAANATTPVKTSKRRPDLRRLDAVLERFFDRCAELRIPVIAHANRSNGRDDAHDEFSSPASWRTLLSRYAGRTASPIIDAGHFGGGAATSTWTRDFSRVMSEFPAASLYGDLGYWDELMCGNADPQPCANARARLKEVLGITVGTESVADRVMFGSDWLMLSQVKKWADYPARLHASLSAVAPPEVVAKILGANAGRCFRLGA